MKIRQPSARWTLWVFAAALLLKSAMPFLASAAAHAQDKALVEICTVYGVAMVHGSGDDHAPVPDHTATHGAGHCALNALATFAGGEPPALVLPAASVPVSPPPVALTALPRDASALWIALLKHGPPAFS